MAWDEQKTRLQVFRIIRESLFAQEMCGEKNPESAACDRNATCAETNAAACDWNTSSTETDIEACDWNAVYAEMKEHAIAFLAQKWLENGEKKSAAGAVDPDHGCAGAVVECFGRESDRVCDH